MTLWHHDFPPPLDHCSHQVEEWGKLAQSVRLGREVGKEGLSERGLEMVKGGEREVED